MSKSLYSVMLTDEVVQLIDRLALKQSTNRSNLINQILAEYVSYTTPEMRINSIFRTVEEFINGGGTGMVAYTVPHQSTMSMKSSLNYRYRPTVKYDVELFRNEQAGSIGRLSVVFRTQSQALLMEMDRFFKLWCYLESRLRNGETEYMYSDGRFSRSIRLSKNRTYSPKEVADAISSYISLFDNCIKGFLSGAYTENDILLKLKAHTVKEVLI